MTTRVQATTSSTRLGGGVVATLGTLALALVLLALSPSSSPAAAIDALWDGCLTGRGAGQCTTPAGVASDPTSGNVFVSDFENNRIDEFTIWGVFVKSWGWGVRDGAPELQTCTAQSGCQIGLAGGGSGQLKQPSGIAVDDNGDVYVADWSNRRVQKFDPTAGPSEDEARFLWAAGGEVNKTKSEEPGSSEAERNLCTAAASGDVCQAGSEGAGDGQFGKWTASSLIDVGPAGDLYVGDEGRIQRFDGDGHFLESIPLPGETVHSLAVDASGGPNDGDIYVSLCNPLANSCSGSTNANSSKPDVRKLSPSGTQLGTLTVPNPRALAVDDDGNVYVVDGIKLGNAQLEVHKFGPSGKELPEFPFSEGFDTSIGIAASSACGIEGSDFYVANFGGGDSYMRAYGPPPDPTLCPPPEAAPRIAAQYATSVQSTGATLKAEISPEFWPDTTYYLQYGTGKCSEGGCEETKPLPPGAKIAAVTNNPVATAGVFLGGLEPATTYHYRFVAQSSGGGPVVGVGGEEGIEGAEATFTTFPLFAAKTDCPNQAFRTEASANLPDCRAYEMVSPLDKNGGDISAGEIVGGFTAPRRSSPDGERITYDALRPFADPAAAPVVNQYVSTRGTAGWEAHSISPPRAGSLLWPVTTTGQFKAFDEGLCGGWFVQDSTLGLVPGAPAGVAGLYRRDYCQPDSDYELLTDVDPPGFGFGPGEVEPEFFVPGPQGFSADESHTVFQAGGALTPDACPAPVWIKQVYLSSKGGPLRLISALPNGNATCTHSTAGTYEDATGGFRESNVVGALSADGSRVFWTDTQKDALEGFTSTGPGNLYLRLNATEEQSEVKGGVCAEEEKACTVAISKSGAARFWAANPQGTKAIYGSTTVAGDSAEQLFEYDVEERKSKSIAKGVTGVAGVSEDASRVYFVSTQALTGEEANSEGGKAQAGAQNLYLYEAGAGIVFVAKLAGGINGIDGPVGSVKPNLRVTRLSPDGLHLAFTSAGRLTAYDNTDLTSGEPAREVYLYDADGAGGPGELRCLSCNPSGARPRGRNLGTAIVPRWTAAGIPGWTEQLHPTRLLSADGNRLFFESYDDLLPRDSNGRVDVYEWQRASDAQACEEAGAELYVPSAGGCLSLISSGQSSADSEIIDVGQSGRDVFFTTAASLLVQDPGLVDVYDARIGGGYPPPAKAPAICEGDACQGQASAPEDPTPASAAFKGAGNVKQGNTSSRCPKGKVKARKGNKARCVTRKRQAKQHAKAHQKRTNHERRAG